MNEWFNCVVCNKPAYGGLAFAMLPEQGIFPTTFDFSDPLPAFERKMVCPHCCRQIVRWVGELSR